MVNNKVFALLAVSAVTLLAAAAEVAHGATHLAGTFTFPSTMCGFSGTSTLTVVDNYGSKADGSSFDSGRLVETFIAQNGRGLTISWDAGHLQNLPAVTNTDGTTTLVSVYSGLNAQVRALHGPLLEQGSGRIEVTVLLDADGNLVGVTAVALAGPNPNLSGAPDCSVIAPYLAAG